MLAVVVLLQVYLTAVLFVALKLSPLLLMTLMLEHVVHLMAFGPDGQPGLHVLAHAVVVVKLHVHDLVLALNTIVIVLANSQNPKVVLLKVFGPNGVSQNNVIHHVGLVDI